MNIIFFKYLFNIKLIFFIMENKEISNSPLKPKTRNLLLGKTENQNSSPDVKNL